jgi:hypothetical protein
MVGDTQPDTAVDGLRTDLDGRPKRADPPLVGADFSYHIERTAAPASKAMSCCLHCGDLLPAGRRKFCTDKHANAARSAASRARKREAAESSIVDPFPGRWEHSTRAERRAWAERQRPGIERAIGMGLDVWLIRERTANPDVVPPHDWQWLGVRLSGVPASRVSAEIDRLQWPEVLAA